MVNRSAHQQARVMDFLWSLIHCLRRSNQNLKKKKNDENFQYNEHFSLDRKQQIAMLALTEIKICIWKLDIWYWQEKLKVFHRMQRITKNSMPISVLNMCVFHYRICALTNVRFKGEWHTGWLPLETWMKI